MRLSAHGGVKCRSDSFGAAPIALKNPAQRVALQEPKRRAKEQRASELQAPFGTRYRLPKLLGQGGMGAVLPDSFNA